MTSLDAERAQQPFQCPVCAKRFTRHENLKRHSSVHSRVPGTLPCPHCPTTFARDDLRKRHIRRKHPPPPSNNAVVVAQPCESPVSEITSVGESSGRVGTEEVPIYDDTVDGLASQDTLLYGNTVDGLTSDELEHVLELYFDNVSPFVQFIHRSTFDRQTAFRPLVLGMACLGVQYAPVDKPSGLWFKEACSLLNSHDIQPGSPLWLPKIQALVLLELYAIMYACGNETIDGLRMHSKSVEMARQAGLFNPLPARSAVTSDLDALWRDYVRIESHKRTCYSIYQVDSMLYHLLSLPRLLSHLEIGHGLPGPSQLWSEPTAAGWAHRSLSNAQSESIKYITAIRQCLSASPECDLTNVGAHSLFLILAFVLSSVRENSGWSSITGNPSFERGAALQSSGRIIESALHFIDEHDVTAVQAEVLFRVAMIDLLMWAPSHTSGIVETSLNTAIAAAAYLGTRPFSVPADLMEPLESHINWFLAYLEQDVDYQREPPWVTMYAFRAVLVGLELIRGGSLAPREDLGFIDFESMLVWARGAFGKRSRWEVGRLIVQNLDQL